MNPIQKIIEEGENFIDGNFHAGGKSGTIIRVNKIAEGLGWERCKIGDIKSLQKFQTIKLLEGIQDVYITTRIMTSMPK